MIKPAETFKVGAHTNELPKQDQQAVRDLQAQESEQYANTLRRQAINPENFANAT